MSDAGWRNNDALHYTRFRIYFPTAPLDLCCFERAAQQFDPTPPRAVRAGADEGVDFRAADERSGRERFLNNRRLP